MAKGSATRRRPAHVEWSWLPAVALVLIAVVAVLAAVSPAQAAPGKPSTQKSTGRALADPGFSHFGNTFYLYGTGGSFPVSTSTKWNGPYSAPKPTLGKGPRQPGSCGRFGSAHWAPQVFRYQKTYVMYYSACHLVAGATRNCVDIATASSPTGPFNTVTGPLCAPAGAGRGAEAIDASPYQRNGHRYLLFKSSLGNASGWKIWAIPMNASGVRTQGAAKVIESAASRMEAPFAVNHGRYVWLFVARGGFSTACNYSTDVFRATTIHGPWTRVGAVLTSASTGLCGPGGASLTFADGHPYIAYHAWTGPGHQQRVAYVARIAWQGTNGPPHVE